jgi:deoxyhypusine synthase
MEGLYYLNNIYKVYYLPFNEDKKLNKKLRKRIHDILNIKFKENYILGFYYDDLEMTKHITIKICNAWISEENLHYFEKEIRKFLIKNKRKNKIIIEI